MNLFLLGAAGYPLLEIAFRGRTHVTMSLAGGLSALWLRRVARVHQGRPLWQQALLGGLGITGIEYAFGKAFNRRFRIWNYRRTPLNIQGQICLPFTLVWCGLSAAVLGAMRMGR